MKLGRRGKPNLLNKGNNNGAWKGKEVGYKSLHQWVRRNKPKPEFCEMCGEVPPYDVANISGQYKRDINDYKWACRKCHMTEDNRINNLKRGNQNGNS